MVLLMHRRRRHESGTVMSLLTLGVMREAPKVHPMPNIEVITHIDADEALIPKFLRSAPAVPLLLTSLNNSDDRTHTASTPLLTAALHSIPRRFSRPVLVTVVNTKAAKGIEANKMNRTLPNVNTEESLSCPSFALLFGLTVIDE